MSRVLPVVTVLLVLLAIWYAATVGMNRRAVLDEMARTGAAQGGTAALSPAGLVVATMTMERPLLAAPHQVARALWTGITAERVTSKRSLVHHAMVTLEATLSGLALGLVVGILMAAAIVRFRVVELGLMPWAIISQTVPIVALAPMIVVLSNTLGLGALFGLDNRLVAKTIIAAYLSFFPVLVGMVKGLRSPDPMQIDLLQTYNATGGQEFAKLRLPASLPYLFASLKVAAAAALVGAIVGELPTGAIEGLGARMLVASQFGQPLLMWASLFASAILAGLLILAVGLVQRLADRPGGVRP